MNTNSKQIPKFSRWFNLNALNLEFPVYSSFDKNHSLEIAKILGVCFFFHLLMKNLHVVEKRGIWSLSSFAAKSSTILQSLVQPSRLIQSHSIQYRFPKYKFLVH